MASVFFYISGHGFGHSARQIEVINALGSRLDGRADIVVRSAAAPWLFHRTIRVPFSLSEHEVDTGVVQIDSVRLDAAATVVLAAGFYATLEGRAGREAALLREREARLVVSDAPPLGCSAASAAGIPSYVCSNFTWDWIYQGYDLTDAPGLVPAIRDAYRDATGGWRLPMHGGFDTIAPIVDVPFVARHAQHPPELVRRKLGLPATMTLALSSFGGFGLGGFDPLRLDCLDRVGVVVTEREAHAGPLPQGVHVVEEAAMYRAGFRYEDLVAAVDVVVTKPGYGIVAECVANDTAILYTSRGRFVEYDVLVADMPRYVRCRFIDHEDLFGGRWGNALDALLAAAAPPERPRTDGAEVVAELILSALGMER